MSGPSQTRGGAGGAGNPVASRSSAEARRGRARETPDDPEFRVPFEHGRWRHFGWMAAGAVVGVLLIWKLGTVGKGVGVLLLALGAVNLVRFARTLLQPAGEIEVNEETLLLPFGLCRKGAVRVPFDRVKSVFFLRRSVPWTVTGPLLIIQTDERAFSYPRDWFGSDSDQRRIAHAIHRKLDERAAK